MTRKALEKLIINKLTHAPALALGAVLRECTTDEERDTARRIFAACGVKAEEANDER